MSLKYFTASQPISQSLLDELNSFMGPNLKKISSDITFKCSDIETSSNANALETCPKFLYYNELEKAYKSTLHKDCRKMGNLAISSEAMKLIADVHGET